MDRFLGRFVPEYCWLDEPPCVRSTMGGRDDSSCNRVEVPMC
jgi:hypothetical protein